MESSAGSFRQTMQRGFAALAAVVLAAAGSATIAESATAKTKPLRVQKTRGQYAIALRGTTVPGSLANHRDLRVSVRKRGAAGGLADVRLRGAAATSYGPKPTITLRDLNGDRFLDGIVTTYTGGAHCCWVSSIAFSTSDHTWARPVRDTWTSGFGLRHLDNDGVVELVATDGRFDYAFGPHAVSAMPITIHRGQGTRLVDVSTAYPAALRADADSWRKLWANDGATDPVIGRTTLAALLADLLRLGALDEARAVVAASIARGDFDPPAADDLFPERDIGTKLQQWGYIADYRTVGLPG